MGRPTGRIRKRGGEGGLHPWSTGGKKNTPDRAEKKTKPPAVRLKEEKKKEQREPFFLCGEQKKGGVRLNARPIVCGRKGASPFL